jgi:N-acetyl-anhydromuramyl-L-alanine amidase AmpD
MNKPEFIVVHHSFTVDGIGESWRAIRKYHINVDGWYDIGYHKGIELVGKKIEVFNGRKDQVPGAHTKELHMNSRSIGICVVGNYDITAPDEDHLEVLKQVCYAYMVSYSIPTHKVVGHREIGLMAGYDWTKGQYKTCPGSKFDMTALREALYKGN